MYIITFILAISLLAFGAYLLLNVLDIKNKYISTKKQSFSDKTILCESEL